MSSVTEVHKYLPHILHEIDMLISTTAFLNKHTSDFNQDSYTYLDSYLIHLRNLTQFFNDYSLKKKPNDDLLISDFPGLNIADFKVYISGDTRDSHKEEEYKKINITLAHISKDRVGPIGHDPNSELIRVVMLKCELFFTEMNKLGEITLEQANEYKQKIDRIPFNDSHELISTCEVK